MFCQMYAIPSLQWTSEFMPFHLTKPIKCSIYPWPICRPLNAPLFGHRVLVGGLAALIAILVCFCFSKDLVVFLEAPVATKGVRFLQLSPGEFFFTTFKVCCLVDVCSVSCSPD